MSSSYTEDTTTASMGCSQSSSSPRATTTTTTYVIQPPQQQQQQQREVRVATANPDSIRPPQVAGPPVIPVSRQPSVPQTSYKFVPEYPGTRGQGGGGGGRPPNVGADHDLPQQVRDIANLRGEHVIAWTRMDPALEAKVNKLIFDSTIAPYLYNPILWPILLLGFPYLWAMNVAQKNAIKNQYWVLIDRELKIILLDHDVCICAGCSTSGNRVQCIPLESIVDCGLTTGGLGCCNECNNENLPTMYVDTASSPSVYQRALAMAGNEWFLKELLNRRAILMGRSNQNDAGKSGGEF